jgi:hypothetical protein
MSAGCVTARVYTAPNPAFPISSYKKLAVWVNFADLGLRSSTERMFGERASWFDITFAPAHQLFYPGRQYTADEMVSILRAADIEGLLYIVSTAVGSNESWVPPILNNGTLIGGFPVDRPYGNYSATLLDLSRADVSWIATAALSGDEFTNHDLILARFVDEMITHLSKDGLLSRK